MRSGWVRLAVAVLVAGAVIGTGTVQSPVGAQEGGSNVLDRGSGGNDGTSLTGTAQTGEGGQPGDSGGGGGSGGGGPNCTRSDGTPDYLSYKGLQHTTMEEQRTEIRPEEQRPGVYRHVYCGSEHVDFIFVPEAEPVDPWALARSVVVTPPAPVLRTSPAAADQLVGIEAWFWVDNWDSVSGSSTAGPVRVDVEARPTALIIDPGDGSDPITCLDPPVYDPAVPASAQSSPCSHTYQRSGPFTATATMTYATSFTSNVGAGGALGPIETTGSLALTVSEAQALNGNG